MHLRTLCEACRPLRVGKILRVRRRRRAGGAIFAISVLVAGFSLVGSAPAFAQTTEPLVNVVQLSAQAEVDVTQDLLRMTLSITRQGAESAVVQSQLKDALDAALVKAKKAASPGQMEVHTGNFSLYPRYDKDGHISNWQGTAELVLEGRDFARITRTAGEIDSLTVSNVSFGLSRDQRATVESGAQKEAIQQFRAKAKELSGGFGFKDYSLREISVSASDNGAIPAPRMMAMAAKRFDTSSAPVPVEPGKSRVTVSISGSVQMR